MMNRNWGMGFGILLAILVGVAATPGFAAKIVRVEFNNNYLQAFNDAGEQIVNAYQGRQLQWNGNLLDLPPQTTSRS